MCAKSNDFSTAKNAKEFGASVEAIQEHYDVGNAFYRTWLDPTMTYSCAYWQDDNATLQEAQETKLEYLIHAAAATGNETVLDIGCGWGSCLYRLVGRHAVKRAVGLTLSQQQVEWIESRQVPGVEVLLEGWADHDPGHTYDSIISIGALEHFAKPGLSNGDRISVYRQFFKKCHDLLKPGGRMGLQVQAYNTGSYTEHSPLSQVFPESDMPRLFELAAGFDRIFVPTLIRNDPSHYARTVRCWLDGLAARRDEAVQAAGEDNVKRYERFLTGGIKGYEAGVFMLLRLSLETIDY